MAIKTETAQSQARLFDNISVKGEEPNRFPSIHSGTDVAVALQQKSWAFLKVAGKSMFPWIQHGDIVFLRHVPINDVARGDVVIFAKNGQLCVHRVLSVETSPVESEFGTALITKGDAAADRDDPVFTDQFRGKVEFIYRRNREIRITRGWRRYFGKFLVFVSPITRWWKPAASALNRQTARCELLGVSSLAVRRTSESSAD